MTNDELPDFLQALSLCCRLLSRGMYEPRDDENEAWFLALMPFAFEEVKAALEEHQTEALKPPLIAEIIGRIRKAKAERQAQGGSGGQQGGKGRTKVRSLEEIKRQRALVDELFKRMNRALPRRNSLAVAMTVERVRAGGRLTVADQEQLNREHRAGRITELVFNELCKAGWCPEGVVA